MPIPYTLLSVSGIFIPDYAIRGATVRLSIVDQAKHLADDCNGETHDLSLEMFRKRTVEVSCQDLEAPYLDDIWPGTPVTLTLIPKMGIGDDPNGPGPGMRVLDCLVVDWTADREEWEARTDWTIEFVERVSSWVAYE